VAAIFAPVRFNWLTPKDNLNPVGPVKRPGQPGFSTRHKLYPLQIVPHSPFATICVEES
jgi:hypothetical protein